MSHTINQSENYPRVSIVNCVSEALEMLKFSSEQLIENAGTDNFDYIIVCWNTTPQVDEYIDKLSKKYNRTHPRLKIYRVNHKEIPNIGYVPNLRAMINEGLSKAFELNQYGGLVNTDQAFYKDWLINLIKHISPKRMVGSVVIMPKAILHHYEADFGLTEHGRFDKKRFEEFCGKIIKSNEVLTEKDIIKRKDMSYLNLVGFPYLFPKEMWEKAGPWELTLKNGTPDVQFFRRAHKHGFKFVISLDSIAYHYEAGERGRGRQPPKFAKHMKYDPLPLWGYRVVLKVKFLKLLKKLGIIKKEPIY
jgi:GT2 family glycosyltransferase